MDARRGSARNGTRDRACAASASHVGAGLLRVVRTRRVRAVEERYYGRTARLFRVGAVNPMTMHPPAHFPNDLRSALRHVRIPPDRAEEFWERVVALAQELARTPRSGDSVYGSLPGSTRATTRRCPTRAASATERATGTSSATKTASFRGFDARFVALGVMCVM
jgi:plasmid stabilization system protein ParE